MSKNKLMIAITTGLFAATAATGAFAQTSSGNSSAAMGNDAMTAAPGNAASAAPAKKHKMHKHSGHAASKKTPAAETGNNGAAEGGQSK
ncbi:hypothetical protein AWB79_03749 [Caballeronia hypogeia]|uniref:Pentapeptide MXKDX repeat protein n=1 Tax=Caballeronia hypogeia TaxID=1777140 RepID=A0A158BJ40_9BURK|nr:hypothetical protein [Caballeronia hypogeia]SAK70069.1 hypothetical protein AWB79_03749 [Caballeronia hypogeia]